LQETVGDEYKKAEKEAESHVLRLCITLLDYPLGDTEYQSSIISGLAVSGIQEGGKWADTEDYTPNLLAVIKLARLMVLEKAYQGRQKGILRRLETGNYTRASRASRARHHLVTLSWCNRRIGCL